MLKRTWVGRTTGSDILEMKLPALVLIEQGSRKRATAWVASHNIMTILTSAVYTYFPLECGSAIGYLVE